MLTPSIYPLESVKTHFLKLLARPVQPHLGVALVDAEGLSDLSSVSPPSALSMKTVRWASASFPISPRMHSRMSLRASSCSGDGWLSTSEPVAAARMSSSAASGSGTVSFASSVDRLCNQSEATLTAMR